MSFSVKDEATDAAVRRLAGLKNKTLTDTIREAVEQEYQRSRAAVPLVERLKPLAERYRAFPQSRLQADKAFFDELSGDA
ncbi:type II toxin-antitoxin system VapB family antitoxin (plasmid) [Devosia sp. A8/3-2]|nr:type II toxin-antitoxin system VapB family antitoxin [Devosia sp. A8/3-2]